MAQKMRVVSSADLSDAMARAKPLSELDASMAETVFGYIEINNLDSAHTYAAAMSEQGLARTLRNLCSMISVLSVAWAKKVIAG